MRRLLALILFASALTASAQTSLDPLAHPAPPAGALTDPGLSPGASFLYGLEAKFAAATAAGGGKAFSSFFADDAVTLSNHQAPVVGHTAIAEQATWSPKDYQLTWTPQGARMSPEGDMGFTWGHYDGHSKDRNGTDVATSGRYFTVWKRQPDGQWKVALDASNEEPPLAGDCCKLP